MCQYLWFSAWKTHPNLGFVGGFMVQGMYNPSGFRIGGMICGSVHVQPIIVQGTLSDLWFV